MRTAHSIPLAAVTVDSVVGKYERGIDLTTKGEFNQALDVFRQCMQCVPLVVVNSQEKQKGLLELIRKISEYITAMRIELERKKLASAVSIKLYGLN